MQDNNRTTAKASDAPLLFGRARDSRHVAPSACVITAFSRREALRQARGMLTGIKIRIMSPGC